MLSVVEPIYWTGWLRRVERARRELGWTGRQLALRSGLNQSQYGTLSGRIRKKGDAARPSAAVTDLVNAALESAGYSGTWLRSGDGPPRSAQPALQPTSELAEAGDALEAAFLTQDPLERTFHLFRYLRTYLEPRLRHTYARYGMPFSDELAGKLLNAAGELIGDPGASFQPTQWPWLVTVIARSHEYAIEAMVASPLKVQGR